MAIDTSNPRLADPIARLLVSQLTGILPTIISRRVPPPTAVTNANTRTPNTSYRFRMAAMAPETAKAKVPRISTAPINSTSGKVMTPWEIKLFNHFVVSLTLKLNLDSGRQQFGRTAFRSEERRVGKECRAGGARCDENKKERGR